MSKVLICYLMFVVWIIYRRPTSEWTHGKRFEAVYHFLNMETHERIRVRVPVDLDKGEELPSAMPFWKGADWFEREAWDMIGINFQGRKKERLLTHHEFIGHPLRKDYRCRSQSTII